jgi:predicted nucleic acid-binding protein
MNYEKDQEVHEEKEIVIQDACILFDLVDLSLLEAFFQLDFVVLTTPNVINEITNEDQWQQIEIHLNNGQLTVDSSGKLEDILEIYQEFAGLSIADSSVLELAQRKDAVIFSSDGSLRKIATRKRFIVRGTLWIIEALCAKRLITHIYAIERLETYLLINQRAPVKAIEHLITKLKNNT